jgi:hypothetical protein
MMRNLAPLACLLILYRPISAGPKPHIIVLGKPASIATHDAKAGNELKVRPLYVDGHTKEFAIGLAHDVTDSTFVVQRIYRVNDSLPQENGPARWKWQRGGWLLVNRSTGKIQQVPLPNFDPDTSVVNWFRDYAAYCGYSDDGEKLVTLIVQLGRRKPVLKKIIGDAKDFSSAFSLPTWERNPVRVTFEVEPGQKLTFAVKSSASESATDADSDTADEKGAE